MITELMNWFTLNQRPMPWRTFSSPYWVWISEAMLQQTQVATVIPYFYRFVDQFPDIETLAAADSQAVLKVWEGLGYYSRARNLHRAAALIVTDFGGGIPSDYDTLQQLPGFGPYIAAAVASIAFEVPVPVVDGNVLRVFSRYWGIPDDIRATKVRNDVFDRLTPLVAMAQPSQFNQAIMELGALVCTPKNPHCTQCPLATDCVALTTHQVSEFPFKSAKPPVPHYTIGVGVIWKDGKILIGRRRDDQMLGGLWEFPGGKREPGETFEQCLRRELVEELGIEVEVGALLEEITHEYPERCVRLQFFLCRWRAHEPRPLGCPAFAWITREQLGEYSFPAADARLLGRLRRSSELWSA